MVSTVLRRSAVLVAAVLLATGCGSGSGIALSSPPESSAESASSSAPADDSSGAASGAATSPSSRQTVVTAQDMPAKQAAAQLATAKIDVRGTPEAAVSWRDENSLNVVLVTIEQRKQPAGGPALRWTLRTYVTAGLDQADGGRLRDQVVESDECDNDGGLRVVPKSMTVADHDGDGHTEATVGWTWGCRGDPGPIGVRLTLFTRGKHYQLSGEGQRRDEPLSPPFDQGVAPVKATPTPARTQWPAGLYDSTSALFDQLYL
jgi:hypothetical protein